MEKNNPQSEVSDNTNPNAIAERAARPHPRRRWLALALIPLAAAGLSVSVASAHGSGEGGPGRGGPGAFMHGRMQHLLGDAGASDAQKAQIKAIWENLRPQLQPLHKQHGELRHQMATAMAAATINTAQVEQLRVQSVQTMDKISALTTQGMLSSAQVLTPDQRKIVLQKMQERRQERRGHRHGGAD